MLYLYLIKFEEKENKKKKLNENNKKINNFFSYKSYYFLGIKPSIVA